MSIPATWALYHRTAAEKNFTPGEWLDSGLRNDNRTVLRAQFSERGLDWQEVEFRLVPVEEGELASAGRAWAEAWNEKVGNRDKLIAAGKAFITEVYADAENLDPDDVFDWADLALGYLIARGVPYVIALRHCRQLAVGELTVPP